MPKISQLPDAGSPLLNTDIIPIVRAGATMKSTVQDLAEVYSALPLSEQQAGIGSLPDEPSATHSFEFLVRDPALAVMKKIDLETVLSQEMMRQDLSVPTGGIVLVDPDGPGYYYNRSNSTIIYDVYNLTNLVGVGARNPKWIVSEVGSTCRIDPGVNKTLNYPGMTAGQMLDISDGEMALVFALDIASTTIGIVVVPAPSIFAPTRVTINSDTTIGDAAFSPNTLHYVTGSCTLTMPAAPRLYAEYRFTITSGTVVFDPGAGRSFLGRSLGQTVTAPTNCIATVIYNTTGAISLAFQAITLAPSEVRASFFGDGSSGNVTISSGTTTLSADAYYENLTINGTGVLNTAGYRVFVQGVLDLSAAGAGAIIRNGVAGSGNTTTTGLTSNILGGSANGSAGGAGGTGAGTAGTAGVASQVVAGGDSTAAAGAGGSGSGGAGGAGGAGASRLSFGGIRFYQPTPLRGASLPTGGQSGPGGGGGGGDGTAGGAGGAGGAGAGVIWIAAATIARGSNTTAGIIQANGGAGANGAAAAAGNRGGGGGGAGGGGGWVYLVYGALTGSAIPNAIQVNGGRGGDGGNGSGTGAAGSGGPGGDAGRVTLGDLTANTWTNARTGSGAAGSGQTGGAGGTHSVTL